MACGAAYNIVTRTEFRVLRSFGERQHSGAESLLPGHRGNTQLQDYSPVPRWVLKAPELRRGGFETKANFGSAALLFT